MGNSTSLLKALLANASRMNFSSLGTFSGVGGNGRVEGRNGGGLGVDGEGESCDDVSWGGCDELSDIAAAVADVVPPVGVEDDGNS